MTIVAPCFLHASGTASASRVPAPPAGRQLNQKKCDSRPLFLPCFWDSSGRQSTGSSCREKLTSKNDGSCPLFYMLQLPSAGAMTGTYLPMSRPPGAAVNRLACSNKELLEFSSHILWRRSLLTRSPAQFGVYSAPDALANGKVKQSQVQHNYLVSVHHGAQLL